MRQPRGERLTLLSTTSIIPEDINQTG